MPRAFLKRHLPHPKRFHKHRKLRLFGEALHNPNLWHLNRNSVANGIGVGLFIAFVPLPLQMLLAAAISIAIGCNLAIALVSVWISNPLTMAPLFYGAYRLGAWVLDVPITELHFEASLDWLMTQFGAVWEPFLLGCFLSGTLAALIGNGLARLIWRIHVARSWQARAARRRK